MMPTGNHLPENRRKARQVVTRLGMDYDRIHACVNDCVLFRNEHAGLDVCPKCGEPRYKEGMQGTTIPRKVLCHCPLIPCIQHMFRSRATSKMLTWHSTSRFTDGVMRVLVDMPAWQPIEQTWPEFREDPHHLRLGLASDGVNPFGHRSTSWSTWPVVVVNYNIPPWESTKKGNIFLSLLVPGKHKVKNMDVYLAPLIEELQELWNGIDIFYVSRPLRDHTQWSSAFSCGQCMITPGLGRFLVILYFCNALLC